MLTAHSAHSVMSDAADTQCVSTSACFNLEFSNNPLHNIFGSYIVEIIAIISRQSISINQYSFIQRPK